ncbi:MAG: nucleoside-diphosphate sugar epimerase/dehydratase [Candidatus Wallbacteria bacterium]|nr:nucleoside-diphosphate sugar epimerase/dehydratase [Candidatus Wallbacteria bacterium]
MLIIGAGEAGRMVADEILKLLRSYEILGFIDDDEKKLGTSYKNVKVLGTRFQISELANRLEIDEILIAIPSATATTIQSLIDKCEASRVSFKIVPGISEIIQGKVSLKQIREIQPEDLLGREKVLIKATSLRKKFKDSTILITGAGGSIGSEITRQLSRCKPGNLVLVDQSEYNLYHLDLDLKSQIAGKYQLHLTNILDLPKLQKIFRSSKPDFVFHAAAYKHVPLLEQQVDEAVKTNIFGTRNLVNLSREHGAKSFVFISTDKAVRPKSVMGMTKKVAEALCLSASDDHTSFRAVRFGNVLLSQGSVVPLFKEQISRGGPVTVTHPDIIRYFMTTSEAAQLVIQASCIGQGGDLFILDMGEPVRIMDLARQMIIMSGYIPDKEIKIKITGLRPGEKLMEELLTKEENLTTTKNQKIFISNPKIFKSIELTSLLQSLEKEIDCQDGRLKDKLEEFCEKEGTCELK